MNDQPPAVPPRPGQPPVLTEAQKSGRGPSRSTLDDWLMTMNGDQLGMKAFGWVFLLAVAILFGIAVKHRAIVALFGTAIFCGVAWMIINRILSARRRTTKAGIGDLPPVPGVPPKL